MKSRCLLYVLGASFVAAVTSADTFVPAGSVSGNWTLSGSPFLIEGDINIAPADTLSIDPGVNVTFQGYYGLTVNGILEAIGTEADSIRFTAVTDWSGLSFESAPDSSHLEYCTLKANSAMYGLIYCFGSNPVISHCRISDNSAYFLGAGISLYLSSPSISYCTISGNHGRFGAGILCGGGCAAVISHCIITGNHVGGSGGGGIGVEYGGDPVISNCTISGNSANTGGGIAFWNGSSGTITDCTLVANTSSYQGGGIYISSSGGTFTISNSVLTDCFSSDGGGGIHIQSAESVLITHCILDGNCSLSDEGGAIGSADCNNLVIDHCGFVNNWSLLVASGIFLDGATNLAVTNSIFSSQESIDIFFESYASASVSYCDFYGSGIVPFWGSVPADLGELTQVNVNADSCDVFYNIYMDPLLVDIENGDCHLTENSPCIDAGDPAHSLDPDGTVTDMGAYWFEQLTPVQHTLDRVTRVVLGSIWPNPFNPQTTIRFELPQRGWAEVGIYDLLGRRISVIASREFNAGNNSLTWCGLDAMGRAMPSGTYLVRLETESGVEARKVSLIR